MLKLAGALLLAATAAFGYPHGGDGAAYRLAPTGGSGRGFVVTADHPPMTTPNGTTALPSGSTLTVEAEGSRLFDVFLVGPTALDSGVQRRRWTQTLTRTGGYKLQYGRESEPYLSQLDFVVTPEPQ